MKIAVFSDVHGNLDALEAVLAEIDTQRPDLIVCGGDLAFGGPDPEGSVQRVMALASPCIHGNTDVWLTPTASRGDEIVKIIVEVPRKLTTEQRRLLHEFDGNYEPASHPLRDAFRALLRRLRAGTGD